MVNIVYKLVWLSIVSKRRPMFVDPLWISVTTTTKKTMIKK